MRPYKRVARWLSVIFSLIRAPFGTRAEILSAEDTAAKLITEGKSLIRLGDGEFIIMRGGDIHYQAGSNELMCEFTEIKERFENEGKDCSYLLSVPRKFMKANIFGLMKRRVYAASWAEARVYFNKHFRHGLTFGDAFLFAEENGQIKDRLWKELPNKVVFVHNDVSYAEAFGKRYGKEVLFVGCPKENAYSKIDEIQRRVLTHLTDGNQDGRAVTIISMGPAGKALSYRLSLMGYQAIDAGHCFDMPLEDMK